MSVIDKSQEHRLSSRQCQVAYIIVIANPRKIIGARLGIFYRTLHIHLSPFIFLHLFRSFQNSFSEQRFIYEEEAIKRCLKHFFAQRNRKFFERANYSTYNSWQKFSKLTKDNAPKQPIRCWIKLLSSMIKLLSFICIQKKTGRNYSLNYYLLLKNSMYTYILYVVYVRIHLFLFPSLPLSLPSLSPLSNISVILQTDATNLKTRWISLNPCNGEVCWFFPEIGYSLILISCNVGGISQIIGYHLLTNFDKTKKKQCKQCIAMLFVFISSIKFNNEILRIIISNYML